MRRIKDIPEDELVFTKQDVEDIRNMSEDVAEEMMWWRRVLNVPDIILEEETNIIKRIVIQFRSLFEWVKEFLKE